MSDTIEAAKKVLDVWVALAGHSIHGLSNGEIAAGLNMSPPNVVRALNTLIDRGLVQKLETGRYAHGVRTLAIATAHAMNLEAVQSRIAELNQRVAAQAANYRRG